MLVKQIELGGFLCHERTELALPESGLIAITGENGSGKSALVEAVAVACWGKAIRGSAPWNKSYEHKFASAVVDLGDGTIIDVKREMVSDQAYLMWKIVGQPDRSVVYGTTTKAQEALESYIGSFDVWRRSRMFSSSDAVHFTLATDGERKRLLESLLGLGKFDVALKACRADLKEREGYFRKVERRAEVLGERVYQLKLRLDELTSARDSLLPEESSHEYGPDLEPKLEKIRELLVNERTTMNDCQQKIAIGKHQLEGIDVSVEAGTCPTCGQQISEELADRLIEETDRRRRGIAVQIQGWECVLTDATDNHRDFCHQEAELTQAIAESRAKKAATLTALGTRERLVTSISRVKEDLDDAQENLEEAKDEVSKTKHKVGILLATEKVLSLKGVRSLMLSDALTGLTEASNVWLARLGLEGLRIKLLPYSELKMGGTTDALSLKVVGAGGGGGYKASSGGERRRIDIAILLALSEIVSAVKGKCSQIGGTLFFDEFADTLDGEGLEAVATVLGEIAADSCVVVITHNEKLIKALAPDRHYTVEEGQLTWKK